MLVVELGELRADPVRLEGTDRKVMAEVEVEAGGGGEDVVGFGGLVSVAGNGGDDADGDSELAGAVVAGVGDVDVAGGVNADRGGSSGRRKSRRRRLQRRRRRRCRLPC